STDAERPTVLVVDANPDEVAPVLAALNRAGFEAVASDRLAVAVSRLAERPFDAVLLDLALPDSDGFETFARIQAAAGDAAVLILTDHDDDHLVLEALRAGAQDYVVRDRPDPDLVARRLRYAIERHRLRAELLALAQVGRQLAETLDPAMVSREIAANIRSLLRARAAALYELDSGSGSLIARAVSALPGADGAWSPILPRGTGLLAVALEERCAVMALDVLEDPRVTCPPEMRQHLAASADRALLALPLVVGGTLIGALGVADRTGRDFTEEQVQLAQTFADQAALALASARFHVDTERRRRTAESLADVGRLISRSLDPEVVARQVVDSIRTLLDVRSAVLYRREPASGDLNALALSGDSDALPVLPRGTGLAGLAVREQRSLTSENVVADQRLSFTPEAREAVEQSALRAGLAIPLVTEHAVVGALAVADVEGRVFSAEELALAQAFADQAALVLENARLYEETQARLRQTETLLAVGRAVGATLDLTETTRRVARELGRALDADTVSVWRASDDGQTLQPLAGYHVPPHLLEELRGYSMPLRGHAFVEEAWRDRRAVWAAEASFDPRVDRGMIARFPCRTLLFVPMTVDASATGGLLAVWWQHPRELGAEDLRLAEGIANQAAMAAQNSRLFALERAAQQTLRVLFDDAPLPMCVFASDTLEILDVNAAAVARYGYSREEFLRLRATDLQYAEDGASADRGPRSGPGRHLTRERAVIDVEVVAHPVVFSGRAARLVAVIDVTARNRAETERRRLEEQLRQAQKMEAVGRLAGGVAHDFNNLLTVVRGRSQLLLRRLAPDDPLRQTIETIDRTAEQAVGLTSRLLAFSRRQTPQPRVIDLNAVVGGVETMLRRVIGEDIELVMTLDPTTGDVRADPAQLEQVIVSLAVNARDAMPQGGRLTIETSTSGSHAVLSVADTGVGMSPEVQARLFEPFFTTKERGKGTGLGLATVYGIVNQAGGHITVGSEPGRGSVFMISLPRVAERPAPGPPRRTPVKSRGIETILVVEDEEGVRALTQEILVDYGYTVLTAAGPAEALAVVARHSGPIDLIVTDVIMPEMSGIDLARRIQAERAGIRILYMSGYVEHPALDQAALDPEAGLLLKPFTAEALAAQVREALGG
ncbi:MAG TPA: GAF domain-containing protein, partial [Methylomirabilota bacterium]|nr:GAF domain-containing protein [Methylomirabilota bacterium]